MAKEKGYFGGKGITSSVKEAVGVKQVTQNFEDMKKNLNYLIEGAKGNIPVENKNLTFDEMVEKYELSEDDLNKRYNFNYYNFYIMGGTAVILLLLCLYYGFIGNILPCILSFIVMGIPLAKMFEASINCYRLKNKNFLTVKEWHKDKAYIPQKLTTK